LNNIFQHAYKEGKVPDSKTAKYLVEQLGEVNYIPANSIREYEHAVLKMYQDYYELMEKRKVQNPGQEKPDKS